MSGLTRQILAWRARHKLPTPWRRWPRGLAVNVALVVAGMAGAVGGGFLVGRWFAGLVIVAESCLVMYVGFQREDSAPMPRRGSRTVAEVLDDELEAQRAADRPPEAGGPAAL